MEVSKIIAEIDAQIAKLQQARALLSGSEDAVVTDKPRRGRPKGSKNAVPSKKAAKKTAAKRQLSAAGRKAIADAMKRRWSERRKQLAE